MSNVTSSFLTTGTNITYSDPYFLKYNGIPKHIGDTNLSSEFDIYNNFPATSTIKSNQTGIITGPIAVNINIQHKNLNSLRIYLKSPKPSGWNNQPYKDGWTNGIIYKLKDNLLSELSNQNGNVLFSDIDGDGNALEIEREFAIEQTPCERCWYIDQNNFHLTHALATYPINLRNYGRLQRWINTSGILSGNIEIFARLVASSRIDGLNQDLYPVSPNPHIDLHDKFPERYPISSGRSVYFSGTLNPISWTCPCQNFKSGTFFLDRTEDMLNRFSPTKKIDIINQMETNGIPFNTGALWKVTGQDFIEFMKLDLVGPTGKRVTIHSGQNLNYWKNKAQLGEKVNAWSKCSSDPYISCEDYLEFSGYSVSGFDGEQLRGLWRLELYVYGKDNGNLTCWPLTAADIGLISPYSSICGKLPDSVPGTTFLGAGRNRGLALRYSGNIGAPILQYESEFFQANSDELKSINFVLPTEYSGANISGNWELNIETEYPNNTGILYGWSIYYGNLNSVMFENPTNLM